VSETTGREAKDPSRGRASREGRDRRFELPADLTPEETRAVIRALERYFARESQNPVPWVLAGRVDAARLGALQARRYADAPWTASLHAPFARRGVPPLRGRGDAG
jgi:hypothetical protein